MVLFRNHDRSQMVLLVGIGLIGSALQDELLKNYNEVKSSKLRWDDFHQNKKIFEDLKTEVNNRKCSIIWSAGSAGFLCTEKEAALELDFFRKSMDLFKSQLEDCDLEISLISSAGGLYEGQKNVKKNDPPNPLRPYGRLKYNQEKYLNDQTWIKRKYIYRLSNVYSIKNFDHRKGLINTLIKNGLNHKPSHIFSSQNTLRDYILDQEVATYVVNKLFAPFKERDSELYFLVNGKPTSVFQIKVLCEKIFHKKLHLSYSAFNKLANDITFCSSLRADGFKNSDLQYNLRIMASSFIYN